MHAATDSFSPQLAYDERPMGPVPFLQARLLIEVGVVRHEQEAPVFSKLHV